VTTTEPAAVVVRRLLPAPPYVVYDEWLDPGALKDWMCPRPARATNIEIEARIGGRIRIDIEEDGHAFFVTGTYLQLDGPRQLSFTWSCSTWAEPHLDSIVTVTLAPYGQGATLMTIHHALPGKLRADHERGWRLIAQQLDRELQASS
jgi:uncharacterized protein YndB with AHSA1/START domain